MIVNDVISVRIISCNINYWSNRLNRTLFINDLIDVKVTDLPPKSNIMIECCCDSCGRRYQQRRSRDLSVCGYCRTHTRMKNNTFGTVNRKYTIPSKEELENFIDNLHYGKNQLSKHYNVSITVINGWLHNLGISISSYQGRKYFKTQSDYDSAVDNVKECVNKNMKSKSEISRVTNIPLHILRKIERENSICLPTKKLDWNQEYKKVIDALDLYEKENQTKTLKKIAEEYMISIELLKKAFRENKIKVKSHSYNKSKGEIECRDFIRSLNYRCDSYMFQKTYEIDCFVQSHMFGIEYCGEYWHRFTTTKNNKTYHKDKHIYFKELGIKLMTIFESEWQDTQKCSIFKSMLCHKLKHDSIIKIGARKCSVNFIDKNVANDFHLHNHISGTTLSSFDVGLSYNGELISVLSFVKSRYDKKYDYEISRFSTKKYHNVAGGFSKMFKFIIDNKDFNTCVTYSDLRFGDGDVYAKNGFQFLTITSPNYYYFDKNIGILEKRMKFQKQNLKKMCIPEYSDDKTEFQIMTDIGYYKVYDCGNAKYYWERK